MNDFVDVEFYRPNISETVFKPSDNLTIYLQELEKLLRIKKSRTRELLKQMVEKGIISRLGSGCSTYYVLGENTI